MILTSLKNIKLKQEIVDVPELEEDGQIIIRELTGLRQRDFYNHLKNDESLSGIHLIIACSVDEDGNRISSHDEAEQIYNVLPFEVINRLVEACNRVNGAVTGTPKAKKKS